MKTLRIEELPALPPEIKTLIKEGVYSLYSIRNEPARFLLLTKNRNEYYFLSVDGDVIGNPGVRDVREADVVDVVSFSGPASGDSVRVNLQ